MRNARVFLVEKPVGKGLGRRSADGRMILKWI